MMQRMKIFGLTVVVLQLLFGARLAFAQAPGPLEPQGGMVWGSVGFQGDVGGSVNSSGVGILNGQRAELDANTWGERYDAGLIVRAGVAFNLTDRTQVFGAVNMEQAEADLTQAGLIGGQPLEVKFDDYQGWGLDAGYRYLLGAAGRVYPFVAGSIGIQRVQEIAVSLTSPSGYRTDDVPFYSDSWVAQWRLGTGLLGDFNSRLGWQVSLDFKYSGVLSDRSGIGTLGFERVNDTGNRWTLPVLAGVFVKF